WWPGRPRLRFLPAIAYLGLVIRDIIAANFEVAAVILFKPNRDLRPAWLTIPLELASPEAITVFAGTISLTPGTVSADVSACGRYLLVHALHAPDPAAEIAKVKARYETRLKEIFR
ncbi:MAG: Na+/H+ antiporter subunit E, partial [Erythrobacteraceae bacterium]